MNEKEMIIKGFIEVTDDISFRTHADVLRLFGADHKNFRQALANHPHEDGIMIWFPKVFEDDSWENKFGVNKKHSLSGESKEMRLISQKC